VLISLRHNLAQLVRFSGRESAGRFWPYAITMFVLIIIAQACYMLPMFADTFERMQRFAEQHPDQATVTSGPGSYSISISGYHPELFPDFSRLIGAVAIGLAIFVVLVAAAVVRRLHDRDRSGLWGLLPLPFLAFGLMGMGKPFASTDPASAFDFRLFAAIFLNNLIYLAALAFLVIQLASAGTPGANRYGASSDE
jgi:uncharacterized membrane protein YhaH (DUF805 family)